MSIYMKMEGIKGPVTEQNHKEWIEVRDLAYHVGSTISTDAGRTNSRRPSTPNLSDIEITKRVDQSSNEILQKSLSGKVIPEVCIDFCYTDNKLQPYLQYKLTDVMITSRHIYVENNQPVEIIKLNFSKIEERHTAIDVNNKPLSPQSISYDVSTAQLS